MYVRVPLRDLFVLLSIWARLSSEAGRVVRGEGGGEHRVGELQSAGRVLDDGAGNPLDAQAHAAEVGGGERRLGERDVGRGARRLGGRAVAIGGQAVAPGDAHLAVVDDLEHELAGHRVAAGRQRRRNVEQLQPQVVVDLDGPQRTRSGEGAGGG